MDKMVDKLLRQEAIREIDKILNEAIRIIREEYRPFLIKIFGDRPSDLFLVKKQIDARLKKLKDEWYDAIFLRGSWEFYVGGDAVEQVKVDHIGDDVFEFVIYFYSGLRVYLRLTVEEMREIISKMEEAMDKALREENE